MSQPGEQAVGFQFQGDVFTGGTLAYRAVGRILRQMSDAGMDIYAVGALLQLGGVITIPQHREAVVAAALRQRNNTRQGLLARALSIGWDHSDPVYEMSRTRAGCAALLTLNAFATGTTTLAAAQGLQELMLLNGCDEGNLPSVDSLRQTVGALSPIMEGSGFYSVLNTIHLACVAELGRLLNGEDFENVSFSLTEDVGTPRQWTEAVHQLIFTARQHESIYIHAGTRPAWLAAFATSVLDLDCAVVYHCHELWRAAGIGGRVVVQVAWDRPFPDTALFTRRFELSPESSVFDSVVEQLERSCELQDALESELILFPGLSLENRRQIKYVIVRLLTFLSTRRCFTAFHHTHHTHHTRSPEAASVTGSFPGRGKNIVYICRHLGLDLENLEEEVNFVLRSTDRGFLMSVTRGSEWKLLPQDTIEAIERICDCDRDEGGGYGSCSSLCGISEIIWGFATTGLALLPCLIEGHSIRVCADAVNGRKQSNWSNGAAASLNDPSVRITLHQLLDHLRILLFGDDVPELTKYTVAISSRAATVAARVLFEEDAYSDFGQYLGIYSGRLSCDGSFRQTIEDSGSLLRAPSGDNLLQPSTAAPGIHFTPPNAEYFPRWRTDCAVQLTPNSIKIHHQFTTFRTEDVRRLRSAPEETGPAAELTTLETEDVRRLRSAPEEPGLAPVFGYPITDSIYELVTATVGGPCGHDNNTIVVPRVNTVFDSIETGIVCAKPSPYSCLLVSAHGNKARVLFSLCAIQGWVELQNGGDRLCCLVLQGGSCLQCAFELAQRTFERSSHYESTAILCTRSSR
jgi:hypothetical protein